MIKPDPCKSDGCNDIEDHDPPTDIFVGAQSLHKNREDRELQQVHRQWQHVPHEVFAKLEVEVATARLHRHRGDDRNEQCRKQYECDGDCLWHHVRPARERGAVDNLMELAVAVAPHKLTAVIDRNDQRDDSKCASDKFDQRECRRDTRRAVSIGSEDQRRQTIHETKQQQHCKSRAAKDLRYLEFRCRNKTCKPSILRFSGRQRFNSFRLNTRELLGLFRDLSRLAGRNAALGKAEFPKRKGKRCQRDYKRHDAVEKRRTAQGGQLGVELRNRPITGLIRNRCQSERFKHSG